MKKLSILFSVLIAFSAFTIINQQWEKDDAHSQLFFTVKHLGISDVSGHFKDFDARITAAKPDFSDAVFELTVQVASIDTRVEARDNHLRSADFFDVEKFPTMTYRSKSLKKNGNNKYTMTGDLTLHGVTKPVTMDLLYSGTIENGKDKVKTAGFQVSGTIKRSDFNVGNGFPPPMISDEVKIKADGEFILK